MPYINIRVAGKLSRDQKQEIVQEVTNSISRITGKPKEAFYITIDELERENWAKAGQLLE